MASLCLCTSFCYLMIASRINAGLVRVTCFANGTVKTWLKQRCLKKTTKKKTKQQKTSGFWIVFDFLLWLSVPIRRKLLVLSNLWGTFKHFKHCHHSFAVRNKCFQTESKNVLRSFFFFSWAVRWKTKCCFTGKTIILVDWLFSFFLSDDQCHYNVSLGLDSELQVTESNSD